MKKTALSVLAVLVLTASFALPAHADRVKSIILLVSDGTGVSQITALRYSTDSFSLERFPVTGLFTTHALDRLVTDSAAGATAFATGYKTNSGMISMLPDGTKPKTVLEYAEERGKSTGLIATSQITHATPACFGAHVESRGNEMEIARQLAAKNIEVLLGGGQWFFLENPDGGNLIEQMENSGYHYIDSADELNLLEPVSTSKVIGLFAEKGMVSAQEGRIPLQLMTRKGIEILERDSDGFFLMVEASQVDWEGHGNDGDGIIEEMKDMNKALGWILDYQQAHPDVLVVWVSDHETGGFAVEGSKGYPEISELKMNFSTGKHTAQMVPAFAAGPNAHHFSGVYDNTDIGKKLISIISE